jgi:hypothetical protein
MTATVRRRTGWNGFTCSAIFGRLSPSAVNQPGIRCDERAGPIGQLADVTIQPAPMIRSEDTRTSTWVFVEHLRPRHRLLYGRRPEDDLRKAPNAQRIYAGLVRTARDHSAEQHSVENRGSDRTGHHHPIALRRFEELAPYPHRAADGAIQCGRGNMVPMTTGLQLVRGGDRRGVQGHRADEHRPGLAVVVARPATQNGEGVHE